MKPEQITNEICRGRFVETLRKFVGPGKQWSIEKSGDAIDADRRTMYTYLAGDNMPPLPKLLRMCSIFGPGFANPVLALAGLDGCFRTDPSQAVSDFELNADVSNLVGMLGKALRDKKIDHRERPLIGDEIRELICVMQEWLATNDPVAANDDSLVIDTTPGPRRPAA